MRPVVLAYGLDTSCQVTYSHARTGCVYCVFCQGAPCGFCGLVFLVWFKLGLSVLEPKKRDHLGGAGVVYHGMLRSEPIERIYGLRRLVDLIASVDQLPIFSHSASKWP